MGDYSEHNDFEGPHVVARRIQSAGLRFPFANRRIYCVLQPPQFSPNFSLVSQQRLQEFKRDEAGLAFVGKILKN
jgi:hypothetical protein